MLRPEYRNGSRDAVREQKRGFHLRVRVLCAAELPKSGSQAACIAEPWDAFHRGSSSFLEEEDLAHSLSTSDVVSPSVSVEFFGGGVAAMEEGREIASSYYDAGTSAPAARDGLAPNWDHEFCAACWDADATFMMLSINKGGKSGEVLARACAPVGTMRLGYRMLPLRSPSGGRLEEGRAVLCHISTEPIVTVEGEGKQMLQQVSMALRNAGLE